MTFTLTEECLFCPKKRGVQNRQGKFDWSTLLSVFEVRPDKEPRVGSGVVVTVCHECRLKHTVEELIVKAREVW